MTEKAIFSGGCFWCLEAFFSKRHGVEQVRSGYTGGQLINPSYEMVAAGKTGHYEAVGVLFDPSLCGYRELVIDFWRHIDPTQSDGQFMDIGPSYETAIFYVNDEQREISEDIYRQVCDFFPKVYTVIRPFERFYPAESRHQNYARSHPEHYALYERFSNRSEVLDRLWKNKDLH